MISKHLLFEYVKEILECWQLRNAEDTFDDIQEKEFAINFNGAYKIANYRNYK